MADGGAAKHLPPSDGKEVEELATAVDEAKKEMAKLDSIFEPMARMRAQLNSISNTQATIKIMPETRLDEAPAPDAQRVRRRRGGT